MSIQNLLLLSVIVGGATYALAETITQESGFLYVFDIIRNTIETKILSLQKECKEKTFFCRLLITILELFVCPYCMGVWVSFILSSLVLYRYNAVAIYNPMSIDELLIVWWFAVGVQRVMIFLIEKEGDCE